MLVDETGETVTVREQRRMLLIHPRLRADGGLEVSAPDHDDLVGRAAGRRPARADVTLFGERPFAAALAGREADEWFSKVLGEPVRLVFADDPYRRRPARRTPHRGVPRWPSPTATRCCSPPRSRWPRSTS